MQYDATRSVEHRIGLAKLFGQCSDEPTRQLASRLFLFDVQCCAYWSQFDKAVYHFPQSN